jgi:hypothetical protein
VSIEKDQLEGIVDQLEAIDGALWAIRDMNDQVEGIDGALWAIRDELKKLISILEAYTSK